MLEIDINDVDISAIMGRLVEGRRVTPQQKRYVLLKMASAIGLGIDHTGPDHIVHLSGDDENLLQFVQLIYPTTRSCHLQFVKHTHTIPMLVQAAQQDHLAVEDFQFMMFGSRTVLVLRSASDAVLLKLSTE